MVDFSIIPIQLRLGRISGFGETVMNRFDSPLNHENRTIYEGPPPQGLSEARRAGSFLDFSRRSVAGGSSHRT